MLVAVERGYFGIKRKASPWKIVAEHFFDTAAALREEFAKLINASSINIALIPSTSYGVQVPFGLAQYKQI